MSNYMDRLVKNGNLLDLQDAALSSVNEIMDCADGPSENGILLFRGTD
jgi:hypothetical protein